MRRNSIFSIGGIILGLVHFLCISFWIFPNHLTANPAMEKVYRAESDKQGDLVLRKAREFYQDRLYEQCLDALDTFSLVYPLHPKKVQAWELMGSAYRKLGRYQSSAEVDLAIYREYPTSEEGNRAYLRAGRAFVKIGDMEFAKRVFTELRESAFFPDISEEADWELRQWSVLSGNFRQNEEFLEK